MIRPAVSSPDHWLRLACCVSVATLVPTHVALAHTFCAETAQQLQDALDAVSDGGSYVNEDSVISVAVGTYKTGAATGNEAFHSNASTSTHSLTVFGGFSAGCSGVRHPASSTILDGHGISGVLNLRRPNGSIAVTHMTLQNGEGNLGAGLQINYLSTVNAPVNVDHLILRDNHSTADAGGLYVSGASTGSTAVYVSYVLFTGNSADANYGAAYITAYGNSGLLDRVTIHDNHSPAGTVGGAYCGGNGTCQVQDSIAWNNTNVGLYLDAPIDAAVCNDYGAIGGSPLDVDSHNVSVTPSFVDAANGNYHLSGDSPLLGLCPGNANQRDLDDLAYPASGGTDMGAYEETVFTDGFDG